MEVRRSDFNFLYYLIKAHDFDIDNGLIWVTFPFDDNERSVAKLIPLKFLDLFTDEQKEKLLIGNINYTQQNFDFVRKHQLFYHGTSTMIATNVKYCVFYYKKQEVFLRAKFKPLKEFFGDISKHGLSDLEYAYNKDNNTVIIFYNNKVRGMIYNAIEDF